MQPAAAPDHPSARNNGFMSQQPSAEVPLQHIQPSVGSIAAHRPQTVANVAATAADL